MNIDELRSALAAWEQHQCPKYVSPMPWVGMAKTREAWLASFVPGMFGDVSSILEIGSANGAVTLELSRRPGIKKITCYEGRDESIAAARGLSYGCPVTIQMLNLEHQDVVDTADLLVHCGVLYHLTKPLEHLETLHKMAPRILMDTHYARGGSKEKHAERIEHPRAGLAAYAYRLPKWQILEVLRKEYTSVTLLNDRNEKNGPRMTLCCLST